MQAERFYRQLVAQCPNDPVAHYNLAVVLQKIGGTDEAIACYQSALRLRADFFEALFNLGLMRSDEGKLIEAAECFKRAIAAKPEHAAAHNALSQVLRLRGLFAEALQSCQHALQFEPDNREAWSNLGMIRCDQGHYEEAVAVFHRGLELHPHDARMKNQLGCALGSLERWHEAAVCFRGALELKPGYAEAHFNLGNCLRDQGNPATAISSYEAALKIRPDYAEARFNRALLWLLRGDYQRGWPEVHWRWRCSGSPARRFSQPLWDGSDLNGRTIVLHDDQGLGDFMQFIRYAPLVRERGGVVVVASPPTLVPLLRGLKGIDSLVASGETLPEFDVHTWLFALPGIFGTDLETIPAPLPFVDALPEERERWRERWLRPGELAVGIVWKGSAAHRRDRHRSVSLASFAPLAKVPGVRLFSLQKGEIAAEMSAVDFEVIDLASGHGDFRETAAVIVNLDLVVGVDTSVIHCAGSLGVPTWVALPYVADWRWLLERDDSPWYPSVRLFRQQNPGQWQDVFELLAGELNRLISSQIVNI